MEEAKFQIGKSGISKGIIDSLRLAFKNHKQVRIFTLRSSGRDRENIMKMAEEISEKLRNKDYLFRYKIIGFTIIMRKLKRQ